MQNFIETTFQLSPFLSKFFDAFGLYNKQSITNLKNDNFCEQINQYFIKNISMFEDFFEYLGINEDANAEYNIFDLFKPGDAMLLETIIAKVDEMPDILTVKKRCSRGFGTHGIKSRRDQALK